jgi:hypothetical protein
VTVKLEALVPAPMALVTEISAVPVAPWELLS